MPSQGSLALGSPILGFLEPSERYETRALVFFTDTPPRRRVCACHQSYASARSWQQLLPGTSHSSAPPLASNLSPEPVRLAEARPQPQATSSRTWTTGSPRDQAQHHRAASPSSSKRPAQVETNGDASLPAPSHAETSTVSRQLFLPSNSGTVGNSTSGPVTRGSSSERVKALGPGLTRPSVKEVRPQGSESHVLRTSVEEDRPKRLQTKRQSNGSAFFESGRLGTEPPEVGLLSSQAGGFIERSSGVGLFARPYADTQLDSVWLRVRKEAKLCADAEPLLASYFYAAILAHSTLEQALSFHLANKLSDSTLLSTQLQELFSLVLCAHPEIQEALRADLKAVEARDPACNGYAEALLNYKGFLACQTHRIAHRLWQDGRTGLALALANRSSEVFHVEIHPAAKLGKGLLLDHATGLVVGESAMISDNVSILHRVTLGGTGCHHGLRHPQIAEGVLIGAGAKLLGPIKVGKGSKIGACSVVLEDVPAGATVIGNPGKVLAPKEGSMQPSPNVPPSESMDHGLADWVI